MSNTQRLQSKLQQSGIEAVLVSDIANVRWASGFTGSFGFAIVTPTAGVFISDSRYAVQAREQVTTLDVVTFATPTDVMDVIAEQAKKLGVGTLKFESDSATYGTYDSWTKKLQGIQLEPLSGFFDSLRLVKTADEVRRIRAACGIADAAFEHVRRLIQPGLTEWDLAIEIDFFIRRQGADSAFHTIAVSGANSARPHGVPSEKKLENGDFVTMDFGAKVEGYCSDITRTVVAGTASDRHREVYGQVLKAQLAALEMMRPGVAAADIDKKSRDVLDEIGLAKYFGHGLGHGLGSVVHDSGRLNPSSTAVLEEGQVWTVEPGVYIADFGGVRIEDDVLVTSNGIEILTKSTKELLELGG